MYFMFASFSDLSGLKHHIYLHEIFIAANIWTIGLVIVNFENWKIFFCFRKISESADSKSLLQHNLS